MHVPVVSILVPVYNGERYLAECLESILAQDFENYELLVADDGSKDGSIGIMERFAARDKRLRWWRNPHNLGLGGNFNACLKAAQGRYIKYVLQDDKLLHSSVVRRMAEILDSDASVSLVGSASQIIDSESRVVRVRNRFRHSGVMEGKRVIVECLKEYANLIGEPSLVLFRKSQALRGYDEGLKQLLDQELWFHLLEQGRFAYIAEPLCAFRQHAAQQTEVNRLRGNCSEEDVLLLERYHDRAWMDEVITPQAVFTQYYYLRRRPGDRARAVSEKLARRLTRRSYAVCWLRHKLTRPLRNLNRSVRRRLGLWQ
jgi:glycosyltransferase involved in cell wall biosynthesis